MSPAKQRPWAKLTPAERIEAVRPLEASGQANGIIAFYLLAPKVEVAKIAAELRREREKPAAQERIEPRRLSAVPPRQERVAWAHRSAADKGRAVKELLLRGKTYGDIAERLAAPSRNSIASVATWLRKKNELPPAATKSKSGSEGGLVSKIRAARVAEKVDRDAKGPTRSPNPKPVKALTKTAAGIVALPMRGDNNPHPHDFKARAAQRAASPGIESHRHIAFEPLPGIEPKAFGSAGCKWPVDGVDGKGLLVCGAPTIGLAAYCTDHKHLSYAPPIERRRANTKTERAFA